MVGKDLDNGLALRGGDSSSSSKGGALMRAAPMPSAINSGGRDISIAASPRP